MEISNKTQLNCIWKWLIVNQTILLEIWNENCTAYYEWQFYIIFGIILVARESLLNANVVVQSDFNKCSYLFERKKDTKCKQ